MSYIEKEKLIKADIASIENRVRHAFNQGYDLGFKDGKKIAKSQESRKDEVILTKEEYGELVSNEFDNGYAKGYREALEQEPILDNIRAEIDKIYEREGSSFDCLNALDELKEFIDKYKAEREE